LPPFVLALGLLTIGGAGAGEEHALRVCADPNNLPFSNDRGEGFENALAELVASDLGERVEYTWWPQRRGFVRNTLKAGACDVVIGVPASFELVEPTAPYYRSSYVFVTRSDRNLQLRSFDDPRLRELRIGIHTIGDDYANVPPAQALADRGLAGNLVGYSIYGDYSRANPPRVLIDAVARREIDVAVAWGPLAGYFAQREPVEIRIDPVSDAGPGLPMSFAIAMGVRHGDETLKADLERVLTARHDEITSLLRSFGVPLVATEPVASTVPGAVPQAQDSRGLTP